MPFHICQISSIPNRVVGLSQGLFFKTGLAYYNLNDNKNALISYQQLIKKYPQSPEAEEAMGIIRDIYVEGAARTNMLI